MLWYDHTNHRDLGRWNLFWSLVQLAKKGSHGWTVGWGEFANDNGGGHLNVFNVGFCISDIIFLWWHAPFEIFVRSLVYEWLLYLPVRSFHKPSNTAELVWLVTWALGRFFIVLFLLLNRLAVPCDSPVKKSLHSFSLPFTTMGLEGPSSHNYASHVGVC